ncbi:dTDP-4-dehydrorhamnose 3,5-epimerase [Putridiphycobacter roseus]|uniref:dTDP-4-dehydrorhamnose 3,5-epimerase n=1 Tax=Putridiphycobacter roseus TaxID=2219161 RepID=A0A2W1N1K5_9FLAO|nr:dTDP-4-dehydrorhamnose 3,5-epimerase [Putridiphycobacter roseus]PZE17440.1 dTDP-4-dehydrorhamnose 3,5-epimerase [Putridiphycobacter roseus]
MEVKKFNIPGVLLLKPKVFKDERGYFYESFNQQKFNELTESPITFVQDNQSMSQKNTLRGLHFQAPPFDQGKLVRVVKGAVVDLIVDIRKKSATYGQALMVDLKADQHEVLWVPAGCAHGFYTLEEDTIFQYKCTNFYHKESEGAILWSDPAFPFAAAFKNPILSAKDEIALHFNQLKSPF